MEGKNQKSNIVSIISESVSTLLANKKAAAPYITIIFIQLLILEIIYFIPKFPLVKFFGPAVARTFGETYLHFPYNYLFIGKIFPNIQVIIFIFISSFLICSSILAVSDTSGGNLDDKKYKSEALKRYVHIMVGAVIVFVAFFFLNKLYGMVFLRALKIRSTRGIFFIIKSIVIQGAPYVDLLMAVFVTSLFAFLFPIIVIENKNVFASIFINFKIVLKKFFKVFGLVLLPSLIYLPMILLRSNVDILSSLSFEDLRMVIFASSIVVMGLIDAVIYTSITKLYLMEGK